MSAVRSVATRLPLDIEVGRGRRRVPVVGTEVKWQPGCQSEGARA